jgi:hypothetical protein
VEQPACEITPPLTTSKVGTSYCTYSPNEECYENGWPECCGDDGGKDCPDKEPGCEIDSGAANGFGNMALAATTALAVMVVSAFA